MITVKQLTDEVRKTVGTPEHHTGRLIGVGLDCGGVMIVSLQALGYEMVDKKSYNRGDSLAAMVEILAANNFTQRKGRDKSDIEPGDVVLVRTSRIYHHLVYVTDSNTIIHSWVTPGVNKVVETPMIQEWADNIHSIWRFNELEG